MLRSPKAPTKERSGLLPRAARFAEEIVFRGMIGERKFPTLISRVFLFIVREAKQGRQWQASLNNGVSDLLRNARPNRFQAEHSGSGVAGP